MRAPDNGLPLRAIYETTRFITEGSDTGELAYFAQALADGDADSNVYPAITIVLEWLARQPDLPPDLRERVLDDLAVHYRAWGD
jgi:hypothetical protein